MSEKQSLFQVYYLGSIDIDRRCSTSVIPWVIEDLKLELQDMKLVWVTLGPLSIDYVADSGEEMYTHTYDTVLRWSNGHDKVSFGYITSTDSSATTCHSFQCLDLNEAQVISALFKEHCSLYDTTHNPIKMSGDKLATLIHQNKKKVRSISGRHGNTSHDVSYSVIYCGSMIVKLKSINATTVDGLVSCLRDRPLAAKKYKKWSRKRKPSNAFTAPQSNSMFRTSSTGDDDQPLMNNDHDDEIIKIDAVAVPTPAIPVYSLESSTEDGEDIDGSFDEEFDVLPELKQLQQEPEFASLGHDEIIKNVRQVFSQLSSSSLMLSGSQMELIINEQDTLSYNIRRVLGCAQGISSGDYVGFITREKKTSNHLIHLIKCDDSKGAAGVIKAFKHSFELCVSLSIPHTVCDTCPIHLFNSICQTLNDLPITDSQSKIHELSLSYLNEQEYISLLKDYPKDPYENEHTQLVRWIALLRRTYHQQQAVHVHGSKKEKKKVSKKALKLLKPLTGSYDNLKINDEETNETGLQSYSASDLMYASSGQLHSTTDDAISREVSPDVTHKPFPVTRQQHITSSRQRTDSGALPRTVSPLAVDSGHVSPTASPFKRKHTRSMSWRQQIFESVTPSKTDEYDKRKASIKELMMETNRNTRVSLVDSIEEESSNVRARKRWSWAINQQLLLIRLDKANQSVLRETLRRHRLNYADPAVDNIVMGRVWLRLLDQSLPTTDDLLAAIKMGVPPKLRERVWFLLVSHYRSVHPGQVPSGNYISSINKLKYDDLCAQSTEYEHVITADIDRTYPSHPYFSVQVKHGRNALYNVLHAYAVADPSVGYCQGLSFVAGLFLLHSPSELEAFELLSHFMNLYSFRDIYSSDMYDLQIKLYQFSRLVHDSLPTLHSHLEDYDVTPFLYAAPWFLTVFSSQFPIPFVARIMDLVLYEGISAIFKIGLSLLTHYQFEILELKGMETITNFLKITIPQKVTENVSEILHTATQQTGLTIKLQTFETEYHVMHELMATFHMKQSFNSAGDVENMNELLKKQNKDLIEQLAVCRGAILRLDKLLIECNARIDEQQKRIDKLEHDQLKSKSSTNENNE